VDDVRAEARDLTLVGAETFRLDVEPGAETDLLLLIALHALERALARQPTQHGLEGQSMIRAVVSDRVEVKVHHLVAEHAIDCSLVSPDVWVHQNKQIVPEASEHPLEDEVIRSQTADLRQRRFPAHGSRWQDAIEELLIDCMIALG
jgi:hypothetical protein